MFLDNKLFHMIPLKAVKKMTVDKIKVGDLRTNCYIVTNNKKTIIIDPGDEAKKIIRACDGLNVVGVLVTHHHYDHVGALKEIEEYYNVKSSKQVDGFDFKIIKTPGHTMDSISFYFEKEHALFSGDFLFYHTIGRTDLPTGSARLIGSSLSKLIALDDDIKVYPGHESITTLGREKKYNTYLRNLYK